MSVADVVTMPGGDGPGSFEHDRTPPQDLVAEQCVLGGMLLSKDAIADVVEAVRSAGGPSLDKRRVELPAAHIKSVGTHTVSVRLHPDVAAAVSVEVVAES